LWFDFALFFFVFCTLCCQFLSELSIIDCPFDVLLKFIYRGKETHISKRPITAGNVFIHLFMYIYYLLVFQFPIPIPISEGEINKEQFREKQAT
jgi:hypothetical protein